MSGLAGLLALSGCGHGADGPATGGSPASAQTSAAAGGPRLTEVTETAGIHYRWPVPGKRPLNILQTIGNGCAFLDYDNDGNLDVLLVGPKMALYRGDGKGHFTDVSQQTGMAALSGHFLGCAVGDYDNDGFEDIYLTAYRGGALLHNEPAAGGRRLRDMSREAGIRPQPWTTSAAFVDVDGDGKLDLYLGNYVKFGPNTQPQLCDSSGHMTACGPRFYTPEPPVLYRNLGGGRFQDVSKAWGVQAATGKALGIACADFDGSGRQSIALANDEVPGDLLHNQGRGFRNDAAMSGTAYDNSGNVHGGMGIDWGDFDNDGKLDLAVATFQHEAKCVYHNDGGGLFTEQSAALGLADRTAPNVAFGVKWLDYDNDGWLDLMLANGHVQDNIADVDKSASYREPTQLFHSVGGKSLEDVSAQAGPALQKALVGRGLAIGDYDNDGRVDVLVVDSEGTPLLLHNETGSAGHWLSIRLQGRKSNRDGIGALVTVEAGGMKRLRRCATDGSYMSASDRRVHVGLGAATVATITVRWPGGGSDTYRDVPVDRLVTLQEGSSVVAGGQTAAR